MGIVIQKIRRFKAPLDAQGPEGASGMHGWKSIVAVPSAVRCARSRTHSLTLSGSGMPLAAQPASQESLEGPR